MPAISQVLFVQDIPGVSLKQFRRTPIIHSTNRHYTENMYRTKQRLILADAPGASRLAVKGTRDLGDSTIYESVGCLRDVSNLTSRPEPAPVLEFKWRPAVDCIGCTFPSAVMLHTTVDTSPWGHPDPGWCFFNIAAGAAGSDWGSPLEIEWYDPNQQPELLCEWREGVHWPSTQLIGACFAGVVEYKVFKAAECTEPGFAHEFGRGGRFRIVFDPAFPDTVTIHIHHQVNYIVTSDTSPGGPHPAPQPCVPGFFENGNVTFHANVLNHQLVNPSGPWTCGALRAAINSTPFPAVFTFNLFVPDQPQLVGNVHVTI
jgi:hypothetical protein